MDPDFGNMKLRELQNLVADIYNYIYTHAHVYVYGCVYMRGFVREINADGPNLKRVREARKRIGFRDWDRNYSNFLTKNKIK